MKKRLNIRLFTTLGCHLCEQASEMLDFLKTEDNGFGIEICPVEISNDDELVEQYGIRIPVLAVDIKSYPELGWPFNFFELKSWLELALNSGDE